MADADDIVEEYEQHFAFKLADGYSEEEISATLGDPKSIAVQYVSVPAEKKEEKKFAAIIRLGVIDFFFGIFCVVLYALEAAIGAVSVAFGALGICLLAYLRRFEFFAVPEIPYYCSVIISITCMAFAVLSAMGAIYFFDVIRRTMRSFSRFHGNKLGHEEDLRSADARRQLSAEKKRTLGRIAVISAVVFVIGFAAGFIACMVSSGSFEFWHTWGWFYYEK